MNHIRIFLFLFCWGYWGLSLSAQNVDCGAGTVSGPESYTGSVTFNYGSVTNAVSSKYSTTGSLGEPFIGPAFGQSFQSTAGFFGRFLLPPSPPVVFATEGDLQDRIEINWEVDPLSPSSEQGFNIYRDGAFIDHVEKEVRKYVDFNVQAGVFYTYEVAGVNPFGEGYRGSSLGFLNPNGVVTGQVKTISGNPVAGAAVTLTPTLGTALRFSPDSKSFVEPHPALNSMQWTVSCWVKQGVNNFNTFLRKKDPGTKGWWLMATGQDGGSKSISLGVGDGTGGPADYTFMSHALSENPDGWHHVAMSFNGSSVLFYIDGNLIASRPGKYLPVETEPLYIGQFDGSLDDVRIFNRQLSQTEINQFRNRTVNADADGLVAYWKFDEGIGAKAYDISPNRLTSYLCGAQWTSDRPDVVNGAVTDESGFYRIEGVNYGSGATFTARPSKLSYNNYALEFNAANQQFAVLTDSILVGAKTAAIELRVNSFEVTSAPRTILAKQSDNGDIWFQLQVVNGNLKVKMGPDERDFGPLGTDYQHLVFTLEGNILSLYKNGAQPVVRSFSFPLEYLHLEPHAWWLGAHRTAAARDQYFSGLIDEVAFYDTTLTLAQIQAHYATGVSAQTPRLQSWFPLNEGQYSDLEDIGIDRTGTGSVLGASWSSVTAISDFFEHEFQPDKRLLTLNGTNTSVDQVDFTDLSTVQVSGFVRFDGTFCYADSVEILVNGQSASPRVFTDKEGKFVADFEPGVTVRISPKFKNHTFSPASWEIRNLNAPVAGILFRDMAKRTLRGQLAGGDCRYSILPANNFAEIKVETLNGCFEKTIRLTHEEQANGRFVIRDLPALPLSVAVSDHTNPNIKEYFELAGGSLSDLSAKNDTVDFIYIAPPEVQIDSFAVNQCGLVQIPQYEKVSTSIQVYEDYFGERCYLDTFLLTVNNGISDIDQFDTLVTNGKWKLAVYGGVPNLSAPHKKILQVTADVDGRTATAVMEAVVTGERPRANTFASTTPAFPLMILRDPPGDNSYAYIEKGQTFCKNWSFETVDTKGGGQETKISLGPKFQLGAGVGIFKIDELETIAQTTESFVTTRTQTTSTSQEVCLTTAETISTSDQDDIVGEQGGDVFMGAAMNLIFGITDLLLYDTATCSFALDTSFMIHPDGFATTYVYSEHYIRTTLLDNLAQLHDTLSIKTWNAILKQNEDYKKDAIFDRNLSFDAGVKYEYTVQKDETATSSFSFDESYTGEIVSTAGAFLGGLGASAGLKFQISTSDISTTNATQSSTVKVGYILNDDDAGDYFTVNVKNDKKYGTPVFQTVSGASSCPWEPNTQNRDEVSLQIDKNVAINVPANEPAVFTVTLGNISQSAESRGYVLQMANGSNPLGAVVKVNGQVLTSAIPYTVNFGVGQIVTLTIERGPVAYDYEGLELLWYADCEYARAGNLGVDPDEKFLKSVKLDVHFLKPCSPVDINSPQNGLVLTPQSDAMVPIRLVDYDETDPELEYITTQFRRAKATGVWINIAETPRAALDPVFETVDWDTEQLSDGDYELRAVTTCKSGLNPGISHVIKVTIERTPPELLGVPEPADGVLSRGDEISITFNEDINCLKIFPADILGNNNIGLYDTETGALIDANISCLDNRIVIVPKIQNKFIEGKILRVQVDNIEDRAGNVFTGVSWEFYVDRSPLVFEGGDLDITMFQGEEKTVLRNLRNVSGGGASFEILGAPAWARISPLAGSLQPGGELPVSFRFASTLPQGYYRDTIYFENAEGNEQVIIKLRVLCPPPVWAFEPAAFSQTMTFQVKLDIEGEISTDEADIVAAFIDGELRGLANVEFISPLGDHRAFLTVYGDEGDQDKPIKLVIWDASDCLLYGEVVEQFEFDPDGVVGTVSTPVILHTNGLIQRSIPLQTGWNWISFNLQFPDPATDAALGSLQYPQNDLIKSQSAFAEYFETSWVGSLTELGNAPLYQFRADRPDTIRMIGSLIDPSAVTVPVSEGWNWIGYLPNQSMTVDEALSSLTPLDGDIVKSQTAFAQYLAGTGWIGSLRFMEAPRGYKLRISNAGQLVYPSGAGTGANVAGGHELAGQALYVKSGREGDLGGSNRSEAGYWSVTPTEFEYSMTLIGMLSENGRNVTSATQEIGAFVGEELRGAAQPVWVDALGAHLFFLTVYGNEAGESLDFRLYDEDTGSISVLNEKFTFAPDVHQGGVQSPVAFTLETTDLHELSPYSGFKVQPNPFSETTVVTFDCSRQLEDVWLAVTDVLGRTVRMEKINVTPGTNTIPLDFHSVSAGVYFVRLQSPEGTVVRKVIHERR